METPEIPSPTDAVAVLKVTASAGIALEKATAKLFVDPDVFTIPL
jgi:hypothetical protein